MKKVILAFAVLFTAISFGQRIQEGEMQVNAGIGSGWGIPIYAGLDYGITNDITIGATALYGSKSEAHIGSEFDSTWFSIGANGNYHFNSLLEIPNVWDVYAGVTLAYNNFSYNYPTGYLGSIKGNGIGFGAQIGGRYYFTDKFGVNAEFGGGDVTTGAKFGISYKF